MLIDEIQTQFLQAFKAHDSLQANLLNMIKSAVQYKVVELREKHIELTDDMVKTIIQVEIKKRKEAIELYKKGNRLELAEKEEKEIEILSHFLPKPLSSEEIVDEIQKIIISTKATGKKDFGVVMKSANQTLRGKADGMVIKTTVEKLLEKMETTYQGNQ
jgi:uncharacterized protein YqeY